jgi:hypothetical protein
MRTDQHIPLLTSSQSRASRWLQRGVLAIAAVSFVVLALFFLTVAVIVGTLLALAIGARLWWASCARRRKRMKRSKANT